MTTLTNGDSSVTVDLPHGTEVGHIRTLRDDLDDIGAPSSFSLAVNGTGVEDNFILPPNATVTFRPIVGTKGLK